MASFCLKFFHSTSIDWQYTFEKVSFFFPSFSGIFFILDNNSYICFPLCYIEYEENQQK